MGAGAALFDAPPFSLVTPMTRHRWHVAPNSERFLRLTNAGRDLAQPLDVVVNRPALLKS